MKVTPIILSGNEELRGNLLGVCSFYAYIKQRGGKRTNAAAKLDLRARTASNAFQYSFHSYKENSISHTGTFVTCTLCNIWVFELNYYYKIFSSIL